MGPVECRRYVGDSEVAHLGAARPGVLEPQGVHGLQHVVGGLEDRTVGSGLEARHRPPLLSRHRDMSRLPLVCLLPIALAPARAPPLAVSHAKPLGLKRSQVALSLATGLPDALPCPVISMYIALINQQVARIYVHKNQPKVKRIKNNRLSLVRFLSALSPYAPHPSTKPQDSTGLLSRGATHVDGRHSKIAPNSYTWFLDCHREGSAHWDRCLVPAAAMSGLPVCDFV